jgi:nucleoside-diphosphate-sugar epimerase
LRKRYLRFTKMILITGKTGFIGENLSAYLENYKNDNIESLGRNTIPNWDTIQSLDKYETIIHLSGLAHDVNKVFKEQDYTYANYYLTKKLYDLFLNAKNAKTFIFVSTIAVRDKHSGIFIESDDVNPTSHYGKSKRLAEEYILNNLPKDKSVYILRPCMVHGKGDKGNLNLLYNFIKKGIPYPLGAFDNKRSFLSIDNFCFIIKEMIERNDIHSGIYHLADDEPISTKNLIILINHTANKNVPIWKMPKFLINLIGKIGDFLPLPINTERIEKLTENYLVSNKKIRNALGKNLPVSSKNGLIKTIKSFEK